AGRERLDEGDFYKDYRTWQLGYRVQIPEDAQRNLLSFIALENSEGPRNDTLEVLAALGEDVLRGITPADRARIVNFTPCADSDLDMLCNSTEQALGTRQDNPD